MSFSVVIRADSKARIRALAAKMGWDYRKALGCLANLWDDSQSIGVFEATKEEILSWALETDPETAEKLFTALQDRTVRFVSRGSSDTLYEIRGNQEAIEKAERATEQRREAANSRWSQARPVLEPDCDPESESNAGRIPSPRDLARLWNELKAPTQPEVRVEAMKSTTTRWKHAVARLKENPDLDYWREVVRRIAGWPWGRGEISKNGEAPWVASFDFLLRPNTHVRALEGAFDDRSKAAKKSQPSMKVFASEGDFA